MQRAGAAEGHERELARVVAALDADHAQRARHVLVDDPDDPVGGLLEAQAHRVGDLLHRGLRGLDVERHLAADQVRREVAEDDVGVGHGRLLAALAVGRRAGLGARRLRADAQRAGELRDVRDRAAAGADGVHVDARDLDPELADRGLAADRRLARLAERDVGRRAAHVEGQHVREAGAGRHVERARDAAGRAAEHAVDRVARRLGGRHHARVGAQDVDLGLDAEVVAARTAAGRRRTPPAGARRSSCTPSACARTRGTPAARRCEIVTGKPGCRRSTMSAISCSWRAVDVGVDQRHGERLDAGVDQVADDRLDLRGVDRDERVAARVHPLHRLARVGQRRPAGRA